MIDGGAGKEVALSWQCPFAEITRDQTKISKSFEELVKEIYRYGRALSPLFPASSPLVSWSACRACVVRVSCACRACVVRVSCADTSSLRLVSLCSRRR
jgi:hypothetical protein